MLVTTQRSISDCMARPTKVGGLNKAQKVIGTASKRNGLEVAFMEVGRKANRADNQRNERKAKRIK